MLRREDISGLPVAEFLAGLGDEKEFLAARAHDLSKPLLRRAVGGCGVEESDAALEREVEQEFDLPIRGHRKTVTAGIFQFLVATEFDRTETERTCQSP